MSRVPPRVPCRYHVSISACSAAGIEGAAAVLVLCAATARALGVRMSGDLVCDRGGRRRPLHRRLRRLQLRLMFGHLILLLDPRPSRQPLASAPGGMPLRCAQFDERLMTRWHATNRLGTGGRGVETTDTDAAGTQRHGKSAYAPPCRPCVMAACLTDATCTGPPDCPPRGLPSGSVYTHFSADYI